MIEITNDLVRNFNRLYPGDIFVECKALVPTSGLLPGTDGNPKMSKSLGNAIYLSDPSDVVAKKVKGMFTDPNHLRVEDPGTVEGNPVFTYLDAFDPDTKTVQELKDHYRRGGLGDGVVKKRLVEVLESFLAPIRARRKELEQNKDEVIALLKQGTARARAVVQSNVAKARQAIGVFQL
jgi:tryptophanyl-tRNA synthetase